MNPPTWHFLSKICIFQQACKSAPDLSIASHSVTKLLECAKCSPAEELVDLAIWPVEIMFHIVTRYHTLNVAMLLHQFQTPFVHFCSKPVSFEYRLQVGHGIQKLAWKLNSGTPHMGYTFIQSKSIDWVKALQIKFCGLIQSGRHYISLLKLSSMNWWIIYQYELFLSGTALPFTM
jgi:hypothetical protein